MYFVTCPFPDCNAGKQEYLEVKEELTEEKIDQMLWDMSNGFLACFCVEESASGVAGARVGLKNQRTLFDSEGAGHEKD